MSIDRETIIAWSHIGISLCALGVSFYVLRRDYKNRQFDMLHKTILSIRRLNRSIIDKMAEARNVAEGEKLGYQKQAKAWIEEMKNEIETLAYFTCRRQINGEDVYNLDGDFIRETAEKFEMKEDKYPYTIKLLKKWAEQNKSDKKVGILSKQKEKICKFFRSVFYKICD